MPEGDTLPVVTQATDPRLVRVRRGDGAEFDLPASTAAALGLAPSSAPSQPTQPAPPAAPPQRGPADDLSAFISGLASQSRAPAQPAAPPAPPPPSAPIPADVAPDVAALLTPQGQQTLGVAPPAQAHTVSPDVDPRVVVSQAPPISAITRPVPAPAARPGESFVSIAPPAGEAPTSAPRPRRREQPAPDPNASLVEQLTNRPPDAPPLVPGDMRTSSPLEQEQQRIAEGERLSREGANAEAVAAAERQDVLARAQAQQQQLEAERQVAMADAQRRYMAAFEEARNARVDPTRFYRDRGVFGTIGVAIGVALGGIGAAIQGGPNRALETIERAIDRDIAAQESNQRNAQATVGNARTFFDMTRQQFADRQAAVEAARSLAWNNVAERAAQQAAQLRDEGARLRAQELQVEATRRAQAAAQAAIVAAQDRELAVRRQMAEIRKLEAEASREERRAAGGTGRGRAPTEAMMNAYNRLIDSGFTPEQASQRLRIEAPPSGRFQEGEGGQQGGLITAAETQLARVRGLIPRTGEDIPGYGLFDGLLPDLLAGSEGRALRQELSSLTEVYGRLHSGGAISDEEFALFNRVIGGGNFRTEEDLRRGLDIVEAELRARRGRRVGGQAAPDTPAAPAPPPGVRPRG